MLKDGQASDVKPRNASMRLNMGLLTRLEKQIHAHASDDNSLILAATSELVIRLWYAVIKRLGVGLVDVHTVAAASTHQTATRTELLLSFESATTLTDVSRLFLALLLGKKLFVAGKVRFGNVQNEFEYFRGHVAKKCQDLPPNVL